MYHANTNQKLQPEWLHKYQSRYQGKENFKRQRGTLHKEESIHEEDLTILHADMLSNSFKIHEANTNFTQPFL